MRKIVTKHICPPIPMRQYDWCAHYDGEEEAGDYGYGATEAEAIADFEEHHRADHDQRLAAKSTNPMLQGSWTAYVGWSPSMGLDNVETLRRHPNWCEVTGPGDLSISGHFGIEGARVIAAAPDAIAALKSLLPEIDAEIEQRRTSGNDEDWHGLKVLADAGHAAVAKAGA